MFRAAASDPVQPVALSTALKISLDNFYDLLKTSSGVAQNELLQLRLAADIVDVSDDIPASQKGYRWNTYGNLVDRCDRQIVPSPVSPDPQGAQVNAVKLSDVYGAFIQKLRGFVVTNNLSPDDQKKVADLDGLIRQDQVQYEKLSTDDHLRWAEHCKNTGGVVEDKNAYLMWSASWGNMRDMKTTLDDINLLRFNLKTILDRRYQDQGDQAIVQAEADYTNPAMRASYPLGFDYDYPEGDKFDISYLISLGQSGNGAFEWTYVLAFNQTLTTIRTAQAGHFEANWDQTTGSSSSIDSDWSGSASGSYYFVSVRASASEHTKIQNDFTKTTGVKLSCESAFRINVRYPQWFHPELFDHKYVKENIQAFAEFFGPGGSLLYYPLAMVVVRGFSASFTSSQDWVYDYDHQFSASAGGGFGIGPICFGGSASYTVHEHEHKIDQQHTSLTLSDDKGTIRFVGYVLAKNNVYSAALKELIAAAKITGN